MSTNGLCSAGDRRSPSSAGSDHCSPGRASALGRFTKSSKRSRVSSREQCCCVWCRHRPEARIPRTERGVPIVMKPVRADVQEQMRALEGGRHLRLFDPAPADHLLG